MQKQHDETPKRLAWNILTFTVDSFLPNYSTEIWSQKDDQNDQR